MTFIIDKTDIIPRVIDPDRNLQIEHSRSREGEHYIEFWRDRTRMHGAYRYLLKTTETDEIGQSGKPIFLIKHFVFPQALVHRTKLPIDFPMFQPSAAEKENYVPVEYCRVTGYSKQESIDILIEAVTMRHQNFYGRGNLEPVCSFSFSDEITAWLEAE